MAYVAPGFDIARTGAMTVVVDDATDSGTATLAVAKYCHRDITALSAKLGAGNYDDFPTAVQAALDAVLTTHGSTVSIDLATGFYTLVINADGAPGFDFSGDASQKRLAAALGFNYQHDDATGGSASDPYAINLSGQTTYVSNVKPFYYLSLARDGITHTAGWPPYEVAGQTKGIITTLANGYGIKPATKIELAEIRLGYQPKASVFTRDADDTDAPWTYDQLVEHVGRHEPIVLSTTALEFVYKDLIGDFSREQRESVFNALQTFWHIDVAMQFVGYL